MLDGPQELIQLQVQRPGIAVLGTLDQKHHEKRHDRGPGINDQLPGIRVVKVGAAQAPEQDDRHTEEKGPGGPDDLGREIGQFPESLTHPVSLPRSPPLLIVLTPGDRLLASSRSSTPQTAGSSPASRAHAMAASAPSEACPLASVGSCTR